VGSRAAASAALLITALLVDEVDGGFGGGQATGMGSVEGRGGEHDVRVVGEAEAFFGDAEHVFYRACDWSFRHAGPRGVATGRDLQGDGGRGSGEGVGPCAKALSLLSGQPSDELKTERPASPFSLRKPSTCTTRVQWSLRASGGERGAWGDEGCGEEGSGECCAAVR